MTLGSRHEIEGQEVKRERRERCDPGQRLDEAEEP